MNATKTILSTAILAATLGYAGSAAAANFTYAQSSGFVFTDWLANGVALPGREPTQQDIGVFDAANSLGLTAPPGGVAGRTYEALWWGDDQPAREQNAPPLTVPVTGPTTPITTVIAAGPWANPGAVVTSATAAIWTQVAGDGIIGEPDDDPDSAVKVVGLNSSIQSVLSYVAPDANPFDDGWVPLAVAFHSNQTIASQDNGLLASGIIRSNLLIDGVLGPNGLGLNDVPFTFLETSNNNAIYNCPDLSGVSCDIFSFSTAGFAPQVYQSGGKTYDVYFDLVGLSEDAFIVTPTSGWGAGECTTGNLCVLTKEDQVNWLMTGMLFVERQVQIPEPGTLAVLGLGLAGMGATLRRRKARS